MRRVLLAAICACVTALGFGGGAAKAEILARVDISEQEMIVMLNGKGLFRWPVSTARPGKITPTGTWNPYWLSPNHRSSLYNNAPMPWSIFFNGNYAIHGTDQVSRLGSPASAGCIRLHPDNARKLFRLVEDLGFEKTRIVVTQ